MSEDLRTISAWIAARLPVIEGSLQAEIVAGNTVKESRERAALVELRAIEQQLPKFDAENAALRDELAAAHKHAADLTAAHEAEVARLKGEVKRKNEVLGRAKSFLQGYRREHDLDNADVTEPCGCNLCGDVTDWLDALAPAPPALPAAPSNAAWSRAGDAARETQERMQQDFAKFAKNEAREEQDPPAAPAAKGGRV